MIPINYSEINCYNAANSPSTVHCKNTYLSNFFLRYLFTRAASIFKFTFPDWWDYDYTVNTLLVAGFAGVINTDKFGIIPQFCNLYGFSVFYRPTNIIVANPLLKGIERPAIGKQCELIRLTPDYRGITDVISYYADQMALAAEAMAVNLVNSKNSYIFAVSDKQSAESVKKMYDQLMAGNPMTVIDKSLMRDDNTKNWQPFVSDASNMYIGRELIETIRAIENQFDTWIGLPNANTQKRERMIIDEVNANNAETYSVSSVWFDCLTRSLEKVNAMFGLNCGVDWRFPLNGNNVDNGSVSV